MIFNALLRLILPVIFYTHTRVLCEIFDGNAIKGSPLIKCDEHLVRVYFETKEPFQGHVYVRGFYHDDNCHRDYVKNRDHFGSMTIPFEKCGMKRHRMGNPKGMMMAATIITSFHRTFVTSKDRAFNIQCLYMEQDHIVTLNLGVSELPAITLHSVPPLPECHYKVLDSPSGGSEVRFAKVGDKLHHRWTCRDNLLKEMYCMVIRSCFVDDGSTNAFELVDEKGCSKDAVLLEDLTYSSDLSAGVETAAFKYADRPTLIFSCQVQLSLRHEHPGEKCPRPQCGRVPSFRARRSVWDIVSEQNETEGISTTDIDVNSPELLILELEEEPQRVGNGPSTPFVDGRNEKLAFCLSKFTSTVLSTFIFSSILVFSVFLCKMLIKKSHKSEIF